MFQLQTIASIVPNNCDSIKAAICFQTFSVWSLRFLPVSNAIHWHRVLASGGHGVQELEEKYCSGNSTDVAVTEVDEHNRRFLCSQALAAEHKGLRALRCGYQVAVVSMLAPLDDTPQLADGLHGRMRRAWWCWNDGQSWATPGSCGGTAGWAVLCGALSGACRSTVFSWASMVHIPAGYCTSRTSPAITFNTVRCEAVAQECARVGGSSCSCLQLSTLCCTALYIWLCK